MAGGRHSKKKYFFFEKKKQKTFICFKEQKFFGSFFQKRTASFLSSQVPMILVTGAAGFIGFHTVKALLARGEQVIGVDNCNDYYDPRLKSDRLAQLENPNFTFVKADIADRDAMFALASDRLTHIVHLAAQAGVRFSMIDPYAYVTSNVMGQVVMLELARQLKRLEHFVYASSSSVYGLNGDLPFAETDRVDRPSSLYAATKRSGELIGHAYAHLYGVPQTGLRFFTVYGPWGRPDMAYYAFARAIMAGESIPLYDSGRPKRDFTYIDDIVAGVVGTVDRPPAGASPRLLNIGNHRSESVGRLVALLEAALGRRAIIRDVQRPAADVAETWADIGAINALTGFAPHTSLEQGVPRFAAWFLDYHRHAER
jgi:UDP-glucuronate 4-epimerase